MALYKTGTPVVDNLTTADSKLALSANQGKALKSLVDAKISTSDIVDNLTSTVTNKPLSANQGNILSARDDSNYKLIENIINGTTEVPKATSATNCVKYTEVINNLTSSDTQKPLSANQGKLLNNNKVEKQNNYSSGQSVYALQSTQIAHCSGAWGDGSPAKEGIDGEWNYATIFVLRCGDVLTQIAFPFNDSSYFAVKTSYQVGGTSEKWGTWKKYQSAYYTISGNDLTIHV